MEIKSFGKKYHIYSVKDELTGRLHNPIFMESDPEAIRWFTYVLNTTDMWKMNAACYSLYRLGDFDDINGIADYPVMEMVQGGVAVLKEE